MKLSEKTLTVLKNFATINTGIVFRPGHTLKTMAADLSVLAEAEVDEDFPVEFGIYDLNQFLGNITTMTSPELEFGSKVVHIKDSMFGLDYRGCQPNLITTPPEDKKLVLENPDVTLDLTADQMTKILRLASMNTLPHVTIQGKDGALTLLAHDKANDGKNVVRSNLGAWEGPDVTATFKADLLNIIPEDYAVEIGLGKFAHFVSKTSKLTYFISLETK